MKIYEVSYICGDDTTRHMFYLSESEANKEQNLLNRIEKDYVPSDDPWGDNNPMVKCLFDIIEYDVEISKTGILNFLNTYFSET